MNSSRYWSVQAVLLLLALFVCPAFADDYDDAARLLKEGKLAAALKKTDAAIAANPNDARARFLKGLILTEQNDNAAAIKEFTTLTQDYPELPEPYNNLAVLYAAQGEYEKAREALEMAIRTHPSYAVAHENLGDVYAKMASQAYDKALSLDRSNQTAQTKLSLIRELFSGAAVLAPVHTAAASKPQASAAPAPAPKEVTPAPLPQSTSASSETKSAKAPEKPVTRADDQTALILTTVGNWAQAWSSQDVSAYLRYYATGFETPDGMSRADWEKQRRDRLTRPKFIKVSVSEAVVSVSGEKSASVRFKQRYQSDTIDSSGYKTLTLTKSASSWLIVKEQFEN